MRRLYFSALKVVSKSTLTWFLIAQLTWIGAIGQSEPFQCDSNAYLFQFNDIYALDLASGSSYMVSENITPGSINAAAYNSADGYIWGYLSTPKQSIVRIGKNFEAETFTIPELPDNGNKYVGDISLDGMYYLRSGGTTYYKIDLNPQSPNYLNYLGSFTLNKSISIHDWAFNATDNKLYTVEKNTNHLYRITAETGEVEDLGEVPILSGFNYTYGAVYFDVDGNFYVSANQTGSVYKIENVQNISGGTMSSNIFAFGPSSSSNDGARCPTAPVPQEDCKNGIDDDGDGLSDCDDPACSGVSSCPVITSTSGGNNGGLESNDRLATLISNRNFQRVSQNYTFDKKKAKRIQKGTSYRQTGKFSNYQIPLSTLIPLGVIGESSTIESSPKDLLALTNATEIYSVDYLQELETVSAVMVLKTANKVYEHSKFICDRFLGAELLSVSNIQIREQDFIKSIIKQQDGSKEFALSFSARLNDENKFVIESHWNIDAYEQNVMYYNFQIWSNSIDDLYALADETLSLLEVHTPIGGYASSAPPPVFVKSARYEKGTIQLQVINTNKTEQVTIEGGLKRTETSSSEQLELKTSLDGYIDVISIDTGALFDVGFRIGNYNGDTPDDLFVADAPWGLDASSASTIVETYEVEQNDATYDGEGYRVERNITLKGTTETYLGVYRAFNPRFLPVDFSQYRNVAFEASGTGTLEVKLLKSGGATYTANVLLSNEKQTFTLENIVFKGNAGGATDFSDLKVMLFNLKSKNGGLALKELNLSNIEFNNVIKEPLVVTNSRKSVLVPNPMVSAATLYVYSAKVSNYRFEVFSLTSKQMSSHTLEGTMFAGQNEITIDRKNLESGIYMYKLQTSDNKIWSGKMVVR